MKRSKLLTSLTVAGALFALGGQAHATSWGDYSQLTGNVTINSTTFFDTTVLNTVTVVCPANGWLMAAASAQFGLLRGAAIPNDAWIVYSITRDNVAPIAYDANHHHSLQEYLIDRQFTPAGMQRVDSCSSGQSVTYKFVAYRRSDLNAGPGTFAGQPRMTVQFIGNTI